MMSRVAAGRMRRTRRVEVEDGGAAGLRPLAQQHPGDHEARDDEEDVDADIATGYGGDAAVEQHNEQDRDGPQDPATSGRNFRSSGAVPDSSPEGRSRVSAEDATRADNGTAYPLDGTEGVYRRQLSKRQAPHVGGSAPAVPPRTQTAFVGPREGGHSELGTGPGP